MSVIVRSLEQEGLVTRGEAQRGRMGPPTIPMGLNPEGAYSLGISIGFRTTEIVLIDFGGNVIDSSTLRHETPGADHVHPALQPTVDLVLGKLAKAKRRRVAGIGLALPEGFGDTAELAAFRTWVEGDLGLEVFVQNDVSAAASGESLFGVAREMDNYLLFYIGAKVHSRLVLNHQIHRSGISTAHDFGLLHFERALGANGASTEDLWRLAQGSPNYAQAVQVLEGRLNAAFLAAKVREARQFVDVNTVVFVHLCPARSVPGAVRRPDGAGTGADRACRRAATRPQGHRRRQPALRFTLYGRGVGQAAAAQLALREAGTKLVKPLAGAAAEQS